MIHLLVCLLDRSSFPTRRSSDLFVFPSLLVQGIQKIASLRKSKISLLLRYEDHRLKRIKPPRLRDSQDRKSTRLNSSHVSTSYAVFCLNTSINCPNILAIKYITN